MKQILKITLFLSSLLLSSSSSFAQIAIGQWRDHLSFNKAIDVCDADNKVYCVAGANVFSYNKTDFSLDRLTKIVGLSDIGANKVAFDKKRKTVIIAYLNANIDLIKDGKIINIADIKRKSILGKKSINNILVTDTYTYLCCGFGIVVLDLDKNEIKDTYYLTNNNPSVNDLLIFNNTFYAATSTGLYYASLNNSNLSNPINWTAELGLPAGVNNYTALVHFNGKFILNKGTTTGGKIYERLTTANIWNEYEPGNSNTCLQIRVLRDKLYIIYTFGISVRDTAKNQVGYIGGDPSSGYPLPDYYPLPQSVTIDDNGVLWIADNLKGLIECRGPYDFKYRSPSGPFSNNVTSMSFAEKNLWIASGGVNEAWESLSRHDGLSSFIDNEWTSKPSLYTKPAGGTEYVPDLLTVKQSPNDSKRIFSTSWGMGLIEYNTDVKELTKIYNNTNSSLKFRQENPGFWVSGMEFDADGNLWVVNPFCNTLLNVMKKDGTWRAYNTVINSEITARDAGPLLITQTNQKWVILPRSTNEPGILVFDDNYTLDNITDDKVKKLKFTPGQGAITGAEVFSFVEDKNGEVWVGTDKGICVFYSPSLVFSNENFDAQQIKIEQDGNIQYLLETEVITALAVDGANRKWIGTLNSGVYFTSSDGTQQLNHFTAENSPLFSNNITSIAINPEDGEVFFGTDLGIISYKGTATEALESCEIVAYPNPAKLKSDGVIAIKGLTKDANVKITDVSGSLIYQAKALGGQAIWDGRNLKGEKAASGVYLIFSSNADGSSSCTTKIMVVN